VLLRPEDLAVTDGDDGTIELVEYYGHDAMVVVRLDDGVAVRARTAADLPFSRGDRVGVAYAGSGAIVLSV
jgi:iron(III) transport system ATP-binding protein